MSCLAAAADERWGRCSALSWKPRAHRALGRSWGSPAQVIPDLSSYWAEETLESSLPWGIFHGSHRILLLALEPQIWNPEDTRFRHQVSIPLFPMSSRMFLTGKPSQWPFQKTQARGGWENVDAHGFPATSLFSFQRYFHFDFWIEMLSIRSIRRARVRGW